MKNLEERNFIEIEDNLHATHPEKHYSIQITTARAKNKKCVSPNACIILTLIFAVSLVQEVGVQASSVLYITPSPWPYIYKRRVPFTVLLGHAIAGILLCFYPLFTFMGDVCLGRYKIIVGSLCAFFIVLVNYILIVFPVTFDLTVTFYFNEKFLIQFLSFVILFSFLIIIVMAVLRANTLQFGADQLNGTFANNQNFILWYLWSIYFGVFVARLSIPMCYALATSSLIIFIVALILLKRKKYEKYIPNRYPYHQMMVALKRNQHLSYRNRRIYSSTSHLVSSERNDSSQQEMEGVHKLCGFFYLLLFVALTFFLNFAAETMLIFYANHLSPYDDNFYKKWFIHYDCITPFLFVALIPLHNCFLRPFLHRFVPGKLKCFGLGMLSLVVSLCLTFAMDTAFHAANRNATQSMFDFDPLYDENDYMPQYYHEGSGYYFSTLTSFDTTLLILQFVFNFFFLMLTYVSLYELIFSKAPIHMRGLLIGLSFAAQGVGETLGVAFAAIFFLGEVTFPSKGMYYYFANIVISIGAIAVFVWAAKRNKFGLDKMQETRQLEDAFNSDELNGSS